MPPSKSFTPPARGSACLFESYVSPCCLPSLCVDEIPPAPPSRATRPLRLLTCLTLHLLHACLCIVRGPRGLLNSRQHAHDFILIHLHACLLGFTDGLALACALARAFVFAICQQLAARVPIVSLPLIAPPPWIPQGFHAQIGNPYHSPCLVSHLDTHVL